MTWNHITVSCTDLRSSDYNNDLVHLNDNDPSDSGLVDCHNNLDPLTHDDHDNNRRCRRRSFNFHEDNGLPLPTHCSNAGLQWAYYMDSQVTNSQAQINAFSPDIVKTKDPFVSGIVTSSFGFNYADTMNLIKVYGKGNYPSSVYIINHRGFLFVPESGTYTFTINAIDDLMYIWLGAVAYSGWNRLDALQTANSNPANNVAGGPASFSQVLQAGTYLPIRILYKQSGSAAVLDYSITGPSGQILLSSSTLTSNYAVQYSCDGMTAPAFPPFGVET